MLSILPSRRGFRRCRIVPRRSRRGRGDGSFCPIFCIEIKKKICNTKEKAEKSDFMPRHARLQSATGIYHVMVRGNNREEIFHCPEDFEKMMLILKDCVEINERNPVTEPTEIYAFCLMNNHLHLLIKEDQNGLSYFMKRLSVRYAQYYKRKYEHIGHLFQDRFKSIPVEDEDYLLATYRYIAQNPVKARICKDLKDYPWGSFYRKYEWIHQIPTSFTEYQVMEYVYSEQSDIDPFHDQLSEDDVQRIFRKVTGVGNKTKFLAKEKEQQKKDILMLRHFGMSLRQISGVTGVPKSNIARWLS